MHGELSIFDDLESLHHALLRHWQRAATSAIADHGVFHVALAGGSTPRGFYAALAQQTAHDEVLWRQTQIYFGDERCVPQTHPDSNYHMARQALLTKVPVPPEQVHPMYSDALSVEENVLRYTQLLEKNLPQDSHGCPVFDLVLLGMGDDGHTASLFPGTDILNETHQAVAAQFVEKLNAWRISLTFASINAAQRVVILVAGSNKARIVSEIFVSHGETCYPIERVEPQGQLDWYLDSDAASLLPQGSIPHG